MYWPGKWLDFVQVWSCVFSATGADVTKLFLGVGEVGVACVLYSLSS